MYRALQGGPYCQSSAAIRAAAPPGQLSSLATLQYEVLGRSRCAPRLCNARHCYRLFSPRSPPPPRAPLSCCTAASPTRTPSAMPSPPWRRRPSPTRLLVLRRLTPLPLPTPLSWSVIRQLLVDSSVLLIQDLFSKIRL